jgi:hypothetical protein
MAATGGKTAREGHLSAIILAEVADTVSLGRQLNRLKVTIAAAADTIGTGMALLNLTPQLVFISVDPGHEDDGLKLAHAAIARNMAVVFLISTEQHIGLETLLTAIPDAKLMIKPVEFQSLARIIDACRISAPLPDPLLR